MRVRLLGAVLVTAALLSGCTSTTEPEPSTTPPADLAGKWEEDSDSAVFLELKEDESILAFDGCNTLQGSWRMDGNRLVLRFDGGTERGCGDIPVVWLSLAQTADYEDNVPTFSDADGNQIGVLSAIGKS